MQKNLIKAVFILLAISCVFVFYKKMNSTKNEQTQTQSQVESEPSRRLPSDFHDFYNRFHSDSLFQMDRIVFPLAGLVQEGDSVLVMVEKQWQANEWKIHKPFDSHGGTFERTFTNFDGIITETIIGNDGMFSLEKRYSKLAKEWHLIYYRGLMMHG